MIDVEALKNMCREMYEQCACIAEKCGSAEIAAQIRKAAGTLKIVNNSDEGSIDWSVKWNPPEKKERA